MCVLSDGSGTRNPVFGFWKCSGEMGLRQVEQSLSLFFCQTFGIFDDFFQSFAETSASSTYKNHQICAKSLAKK